MIYSRGVSKKQGRQEISAPPGSNGEGVTISYAYNAAPRLITVTSSLVDSNHPATLLSALHYNPAGALLTGTLGNNVSETRTFDARLRLTSVSNGSIYSLTIPSSGGYAPNGNILAANDNVNGNWTYGYDDFNRLLTANATGQAYTYDYDRYGNRWHQNGPHSSQLGFDANNRITGVTGVAFDSAGNTTGDGTTTYTFDAEGRISSSNNTANGLWCDTYNAEGQRVRKTHVTQGTCPAPTQSTSYDFLYDLSGHEIAMVSGTGVWDRGEVYAGGRHLATYNNATTYFIHTDWLGTDRVRTTVSGTVYQACTSLPFGDNFYCPNSDATPTHFTGKQHLYESGLDNFDARYYTSPMGRFMSPDWASKPTAVPYAMFGDPQSLNLYSYAGNSPLSHADVDGHCWPFCGVAVKLAAWVGAGVATQGGKQFAQNVGIGAAKGAGTWVANTARTAVALGQASSPGGAVSAMQTMTAPLPSALTPSNQTQADVSKATQVTLTVASVAVPLLAEASAASTTTTLFRAVGTAEAESIDATGAFSGAPNGTMFKGFFFDQADAESFGARMTEMTGEPHTVVSGEAPTDLVNSSPPHSAATEGPGVLIGNENLPQVKPND